MRSQRSGLGDRQTGRLAASQGIFFPSAFFVELWAKQRVGVLVNLFGAFKVFFVAPVIFELAFIRRVITTNLRSRFVDAATVIVAQMFAGRVNEQVPRFVVDENAGTVMQQIPTHEIEVATIDRFIDGECKIVTALGGAVFAQVFVFRKIATTLTRGWCNGRHSFGASLKFLGD